MARARICVGLVIAALVTAAAGCGGSDSSNGAADVSPAGGSYPVSVQNCGRTLTFDRAPSRVVTGYEPVLETMLALGLKDRIVGRFRYDENGPEGFPAGSGFKAAYEKIPEVSDSILFPNRETMLSLGADFVISEGWYNFNAAKGRATIAELDEAKAPVFITGGWCDAAGQKDFQIADTVTDVRDLGRIFGVPKKAEQVATGFEKTIAEVRTAVTGLPRPRVLAVDSTTSPFRAYGGAGLTNQLIEAAGGTNVLAGTAEDIFDVSPEAIAASNPDVVIVSDYAPGDTAAQKAAATFAVVPDSPAARDRRFLALPVVGQHPGYRNILSLEQIARYLHPDAAIGR